MKIRMKSTRKNMAYHLKLLSREERFLIIGIVKESKICIVSHCYRDNDNVIRLILTREATKNEKRHIMKVGELYERRI